MRPIGSRKRSGPAQATGKTGEDEMRTQGAMGIRMAVFGGNLLTVGVAEADILPVATPGAPLGPFPYTVKSPSAVTLTIRQGGVDQPGWLPEPGIPIDITVKVNGAEVTSGFTISLVPPATGVTFDGATNPFLNATTLTTSAYPGQCSNTDNPPGDPLTGGLPNAPDH